MKKLAVLIIPILTLLFGAFTAPKVRAQAPPCRATANVGSTIENNGQYRVNILIDASQLYRGNTYGIDAWFNGRPGIQVTSFVYDGVTAELQESFDISKPTLWPSDQPADVHFSIQSIGGVSCETNQITLGGNLPPNTNENLPSLPSPSPTQPLQSAGELKFCTTTGGQGIQTALGCIPTDPSTFIGRILQISIGIAGGIAFLLILLGGFQILTSTGNPEQLNAGRELVSSAIAGLLLIIFSIFILKVIGVNILGIPEFK